MSRIAQAAPTRAAVFLTRAAAATVTPLLPPPSRSRTKLWELNGSLHCSVIGTCLTTAELRRAMGKVMPVEVSRYTDHDLHSHAVGLCERQGPAAKLLHKTLDQRHEVAVRRFARLAGEASVLAAWAEARAAGDIPGAYWAVLTHPDCGHGGIRRAFGDVHMLSHLVGAANRADIRRLTALEEENAALRAKVERQQLRLHEAVTSRETTIRRLGTLAASRVEATTDSADDDALAGLRHLVGDLQHRLDRETGRRERLEQRLAEALDAAQRSTRQAEAANAQARAAERELAAVEQLHAAPGGPVQATLPASRVLYVGGRPTAIEQMRSLLQQAGGIMLLHDGGRHDNPSLLPGLVGQADQVVFPVGCVSHDAALAVKRLCRQLGKPFSPLRSSGLASFLAAVSDDSQAEPTPEPIEVTP